MSASSASGSSRAMLRTRLNRAASCWKSADPVNPVSASSLRRASRGTTARHDGHGWVTARTFRTSWPRCSSTKRSRSSRNCCSRSIASGSVAAPRPPSSVAPRPAVPAPTCAAPSSASLCLIRLRPTSGRGKAAPRPAPRAPAADSSAPPCADSAAATRPPRSGRAASPVSSGRSTRIAKTPCACRRSPNGSRAPRGRSPARNRPTRVSSLSARATAAQVAPAAPSSSGPGWASAVTPTGR